MHITEFSYHLPNSLIAQQPLEDRSSGRLMIANRSSGTVEHAKFSELPGMLQRGDCLVVNRSRVLPARLYVRRATGGRVEVFFLEKCKGGVFSALINPAGKLKPGEILTGEQEEYSVKFLKRTGDREGEFELESPGCIEEVLDRNGHVPLPPYINRQDENLDRERYQTIFAREPGSVAAPTAGLHFDEQTLEAARARGANMLSVILHVGPGTFLPLENEIVKYNRLHSEFFKISADTIEAVRLTRENKNRVIAVGTTSARVLEACGQMNLFDKSRPGGGFQGRTDLFIYPGYEFKVVDALVTNFHLPESSLLLLVCAFLGKEKTLNCYKEAVAKKYRFYSYGDAMFIR